MTIVEFILFSNFVQPQAGVVGLEGLSGFYAGHQIEDPTHGYFVFLWPSLKARHNAKLTGPYNKLLASAGNYVNSHVLPEPSPEENLTKVFGAPVTEFAVAKLRSEDKRSRWLEVVDMTSSGISECEGGIAGIRADRTVTDGGCFVFLFGWVSREHHLAALSMPFADDIYKETLALTDFNAQHAKLHRYL